MNKNVQIWNLGHRKNRKNAIQKSMAKLV